MKKYWVFLALVLIVAFGCKQRVVTQPEGQQPGQQQQEMKAAEKIQEQKVASVAPEDVSGKYLETSGMFEDILFDFDKYDIKPQYKTVLQSVSSWMTKNSSPKLSVEGHCDDRGTNEYNLALGDRRAKAVKDYLLSLGVPSARIDTISYGEEKPLCTDQNEECWSKNRRAHFVVLNKGK
ncbi:MAG: peptidoglycan-associated lipoprotein Pal [Nitrospirota bacterium]